MRPVHLTLAAFCHVLLVAVVLHFTSLAAALPLSEAPAKPAAAVVPQPKQAPIAVVAAGERAEPKSGPKESLEQRSAIAQPVAVQVQQQQPQTQQKPKDVAAAPALAPAQPKTDSAREVHSSAPVIKHPDSDKGSLLVAPHVVPISKSPNGEKPAKNEAAILPALTERKATAIVRKKKEEEAEAAAAAGADKAEEKRVEAAPMAAPKSPLSELAPRSQAPEPKAVEPAPAAQAPTSPLASQQAGLVQPQPQPQPQAPAPKKAEEKQPPAMPQPAALTDERPVEASVKAAQAEAPAPVVVAVVVPVATAAAVVAAAAGKPTVIELPPQPVAAPAAAPKSPMGAARVPAVVMGGLGPLHLLASTLCSYQPDKLVADEHLNQLYARRASVRKSLFEFMSLKFTNLEKLSSRLGYGLQVVPVKSPEDNKAPGLLPSHGWPVVGKCTAHDLKLMGEAAWCECNEAIDQGCSAGAKSPADASASVSASAPAADQKVAADALPPPPPSKPSADASSAVDADEHAPPRITSNQHRGLAALGRSLELLAGNPSQVSLLPSPEESSVMSKILHVGNMKDAPLVESSIYNLNLTQHQLASLEAQATSTQSCRRNALQYTKALFNHLAEDQKLVSESWPRLYALISSDDCARKRMIDIVNALSSFRTDTTSIRRDNLEFAFAMDDLRAKVLESEVNVPLTFDRHFIEVEQFLQQSVRLMLANIQPKRAKLTSMRYRSLMYGTSQSSDDQCIDLHQRLLSRNYPNDCNPTQFGQLPDVLRMTASSLELWSIEKELSTMQAPKMADNNVDECIANLVSS